MARENGTIKGDDGNGYDWILRGNALLDGACLSLKDELLEQWSSWSEHHGCNGHRGNCKNSLVSLLFPLSSIRLFSPVTPLLSFLCKPLSPPKSQYLSRQV